MNTAAHEWLLPAEAAAVLRVSRTTVYRLVRGGIIVAARLPGGGIRIRASDVEALLDPTYDAKGKP